MAEANNVDAAATSASEAPSLAENGVQPREIMDLSDVHLLEMFDHFDMEALCAIAGTCQRFKDIARTSFKSRKIANLQITIFGTFAKNGYTAMTPAIFLQIVRHFGDLLHSIKYGYIGEFVFKPNVFKAMPVYCAGTLRELTTFGAHPYTVLDDPRAIELFSHLTKLELHMVSFPSDAHLYSVCNALEELIIDDASTAQDLCMANTYPNLKRIEVTHYRQNPKALVDFREFCLRHEGQLIDVYFDCGEHRLVPQSARLNVLQRLTVRHFCTDIEWARAQRWIGLRIIDGKSNTHFAECLRNGSTLMETLEELYLVYSWHQISHWPLFAAIQNLRILHIKIGTAADEMAYDELAKALNEFLDTTVSQNIANIEIEVELNAMFRKLTFERSSVICKQRNIVLTIHGIYQLGANESIDRVLTYFGRHDTSSFSKKHHVYADLGKKSM